MFPCALLFVHGHIRHAAKRVISNASFILEVLCIMLEHLVQSAKDDIFDCKYPIF